MPAALNRRLCPRLPRREAPGRRLVYSLGSCGRVHQRHGLRCCTSEVLQHVH